MLQTEGRTRRAPKPNNRPIYAWAYWTVNNRSFDASTDFVAAFKVYMLHAEVLLQIYVDKSNHMVTEK